jgi:hypothetical protein
MRESGKIILSFTVRITLYIALMVILNLVYMHDATHVTTTGKFGENSWTEILQEAFLFITGLVFIAIGRYDRELNSIANLVSVFFFMAFIREFNNQISYWPYLEIPLIILFLGLTFYNRTKLISSFLRLLNHRALAWLVIGFLITFVFSRLFGRTGFWQQLLENDYNRWAKNAAEEGIELLGYTLLFIGGVELLVEALKKKSSPQIN